MRYRKRTVSRFRRRVFKRRPTKRVFRKVKKAYRKTVKGHYIHEKFTVDVSANQAFNGYRNNTNNYYIRVTNKLSDIPGIVNYTNIFDYYRLNKIVLKAIAPAKNPYFGAGGLQQATISTNVQQSGPNEIQVKEGQFVSVVDYTGTTTISSPEQLWAGNRPKSSSLSRGHTRAWRPAIATPAFATSLTWGYKPMWKQWINTLYPDVPHYGIWLGMIDRSYFEFEYMWRVTFYVSFKSTIKRTINLTGTSKTTKEEDVDTDEEKTDEEKTDDDMPDSQSTTTTIRRNYARLSITEPPVIIKKEEIKQ